MNKMCAVALLWMACAGQLAWGQDTTQAWNGMSNQSAYQELTPAGLRFSSANPPATVLTGSVSNHQPGMPGMPCNTCGAWGCYHWTQLPWYGAWENHHGHGGYYGGKYCNTCR